MRVLDILAVANKAGVELYLKEGQLAYRAKGAGLSNELKQILKENKSRLITHLNLIDQLRTDIKVVGNEYNPKAAFMLSDGQKRCFFATQRDKSSFYLNMPMGMDLIGDFSIDIFNKSLMILIERHQILKTNYIQDSSGIVKQIIKPESSFSLDFVDISDKTASQQLAVLAEIEVRESTTPFDLSIDYVVRGRIVKCGPKKHSVFITLHHIAADDWSIGIFKNELSTIYNQLSGGLQVSLPKLEVQYVDYANWQSNIYTDGNLDSQLEYWQERLDNAPLVHSIPLDKQRGTKQSNSGSNVIRRLDKSVLNELKLLARNNSATLFSVVAALYNAFLHRYTDQDELVIGVPVANRDKLCTAQLIGFFVNMLPIRSTLEEQTNFESYLKQYQHNLLSDFEYQHVPFNMIVESLGISGGKAHNPLFQIAIVMGNSDIGEINFRGLSSSDRELKGYAAKYDLALRVGETKDGITFNWEYATALFEEDSISRMSDYFNQFVLAVIKNCDKPVVEIPLVTCAIKEHTHAYSEEISKVSVIDAFIEQAKINPSNLALSDSFSSLTYSEVHERSNQIAYKLLSLGIQSSSIVAIELEKSIDLFVTVLGILKSGAAYLPIDPTLPGLRKSRMLKECNVSFAIATEENITAAHYKDIKVLTHFDVMATAALPVIDPHDLAYVLYTSGSTGQPKGVMISHKGMVNLAEFQRTYFKVTPQSIVLQFASFSFDASVWEWCMALLNGACLQICSDHIRTSPILLTEYLKQNKITHATLPPSILSSLVCENDYAFEALIVAGEKCPDKLADQWCEEFPLFNAYGPTETTVCATVGRLRKGEGVHIGTAIDDFKVLVLDKRQQLVPDGAVGELYISGIGVALGYIGNLPLTQERFITRRDYGREQTYYRSGDLVRARTDGQLEFLNRVDDQVKIRGVRIELGEIEQQLMQEAAVRSAKAVVHNMNLDNAEILAFIELEKHTSIDEYHHFTAQKIESNLSLVLPESMLPNAVIAVENFPLTRNGKIDTGKLIEHAQLYRASSCTECETETELSLRNIWSELTGTPREQIGKNTNFYHIGGNSLLITKMLISIEQYFAVRLEIVDVISKQKLAEVSALIEARNIGQMAKLESDYQLDDDEMEVLL
ncbi:non-ribosomal peptide synthetase [Pseudoalteromonas aurantia]|uniref:Carrier domain-containing protein n=1 Tax=Pseudoalteromonas aurantia TaxID=43654 RepID=A0A5S3VCL2_9GAMM|nr:non-ribosomal peptide synthetase [Pseudoalteromonas aurantia]TMO69887.1 hypothetical protein CWC19_03360 [Pseudoalteromonas aurantia]